MQKKKHDINEKLRSLTNEQAKQLSGALNYAYLPAEEQKKLRDAGIINVPLSPAPDKPQK